MQVQRGQMCMLKARQPPGTAKRGGNTNALPGCYRRVHALQSVHTCGITLITNSRGSAQRPS
mgnify:CR=1 FL=1